MIRRCFLHSKRSSFYGQVAAVELGGNMKKLGSCKVLVAVLQPDPGHKNLHLQMIFPSKKQIVDDYDHPLPLDNEENENGFSRKCWLSSKASSGLESLSGRSQVAPLTSWASWGSWGSWSIDTSLCCHGCACKRRGVAQVSVGKLHVRAPLARRRTRNLIVVARWQRWERVR